MLPLLLAALFWLFLHLGLSGSRMRDAITARIGERRFQGGFVIASFIAIGLLVAAWRAAEPIPLWPSLPWLRWVAVLAMLPAFMLFAGSVVIRNPTSVGGAGARVQGMLRLTRHPMLWSFAIWGVVHAAANGTLADLIFFGVFAATALAGMPSIDAKLTRRDPAGFAAVRQVTSILPGAAISAGRNRLAAGELVLPVLLGAALWLALLLLHPWLFGVAPLPG